MRASLPAIVVVFLVLSGCATPVERIATTQSGRPEVTIATTDVGRIKSLIIGDLVNYGYTVETDTEYSLALTRKLTGGEDMAAALAVGNGYSTNTRLATYTFVRDENSIRVIYSGMWRAQMPGGQINTQPLDNNNQHFNTFQQQLLDIKAKIEQVRD